MNNNVDVEDYKKDFYRISKERYQVYLDTLDEILDRFRSITPKKNSDKVEWFAVSEAWVGIIDLVNSLRGFRLYEDKEGFDDYFMFAHTHIDTWKYYQIEFKNELRFIRFSQKIYFSFLKFKLQFSKIISFLHKYLHRNGNRKGNNHGKS